MADPRPPVCELTVATYNVHHCVGTDAVLDVDRIAANIKTSGADIVGVQELDKHYSDRSNFADQPARIAAELGYDYVFAASIDNPSAWTGSDSQYGIAIFSRYPIAKSVHKLLPVASGQEPRALLGAEIAVDARVIWFHTTHLGLTPSDRRRQVAAITDVVDPSLAPTFLTGDFKCRGARPRDRGAQCFYDRRMAGRWPRMWAHHQQR